jgi:hypothetical protein
MQYVRLYTGPDGLSHFEDVEVSTVPGTQPQTELSHVFPVKGMVMRHHGVEYEQDFHVAPRRQFVVNLVGEVEIVASGGETRRFGPGSIMLAEDTTGKGHISRLLTNERFSLFIHLD